MGFFLDNRVRAAALASALGLFAAVSPIAFGDGFNVPMRGIAAGTFYVEADVAGIGMVDFLVDTGSGYTAIGATLLERMERTGDAVFVKQLEGVMADGSLKVVPVYRLSEIRLGECQLRNVEAAVFGPGTRPILGMRDLSRLAPFTFSTNPPGMRMGQCDTLATAEATPPVTEKPAG